MSGAVCVPGSWAEPAGRWRDLQGYVAWRGIRHAVLALGYWPVRYAVTAPPPADRAFVLFTDGCNS